MRNLRTPLNPDRQMGHRQGNARRRSHCPGDRDPVHRQRWRRAQLNAKNDFFDGCEAASAETEEISKLASTIRRRLYRCAPGIGKTPVKSDMKNIFESKVTRLDGREIAIAIEWLGGHGFSSELIY